LNIVLTKKTRYLSWILKSSFLILKLKVTSKN
jgi:hypothetical protein